MLFGVLRTLEARKLVGLAVRDALSSRCGTGRLAFGLGVGAGAGVDIVALGVGTGSGAGAENVFVGAGRGPDVSAPVSSETMIGAATLPLKNSAALRAGSALGASGKMSAWKLSDCITTVEQTSAPDCGIYLARDNKTNWLNDRVHHFVCTRNFAIRDRQRSARKEAKSALGL